MTRLISCLIGFSVTVLCLQMAQAETAGTVTYNKLEEVYQKETASSQLNYFVPAPVQTFNGAPSKYSLLSNELIVLYDYEKAGHSLEDIIDAVNGIKSSPGLTSGLGNPVHARFLIPFRLSKSEMSMIMGMHPKATLQKYVVLEYPIVISEEGITHLMEALAKNPLIQWVENNHFLLLSVTPMDPLFLGTSSPPTPLSHQWGLQMMNLQAAWDYVKGSAYIAALDNGIEMLQPDLQKNFRGQFSLDVSNCYPPQFLCNDHNVDELKYGGEWAGHGTHVAGIIAANSNDPSNNIGVAGICWNCSFMMGKISGGQLPDGTHLTLKDKVLTGIDWFVGTGVQAINMSINDYTTPSLDCSLQPLNSWCQAINLAEDNDVVLINAAGNGDGCSYPITPSTCVPISLVRPPGSDNRVLSIGAYDPYTNSPASFSDYGSRLDLLAPGVDILSTFYTGKTWSNNWNCLDTFGGSGPCTGTSMAAPHITGLVGLLRSANPLLSKTNIKDILTYNASGGGIRINDFWGYGIPDAADAVKAALGTVGGKQLPNRLTPLFSFYSSAAEDHFYTTVPQMGLAAMSGTLEPQPPTASVSYSPVGAATPGYSGFPCQFSPCSSAPEASVYIFSTGNVPFEGASPLVPLSRLSYQGNYTGNNPSHVDHIYAVDSFEVISFINLGYQLDGIEGYIYPRSMTPQPAGTVRLFRKYNSTRDDHAIFPESELATMAAQGYIENEGNEWIGYVYPNADTDGDGLIDGFERLIGTCVGIADTNGDGTPDGTSVMQYSNSTHSYKDPGLCNYITVSPTSQDFGTCSVGYPPPPVTFTIHHGGSVVQEPDLAMGTISVNDTLNFTVLNNTCSGQKLSPGGSCSFAVEFHPISTGSKNAVLTILSNDPLAPSITISIIGTGVPLQQLTVTKSGAGTGTVWSSSGSINCGLTCSASYSYNAQVSLIAVPDTGGPIFTSWSGNTDCADGQVAMDSDKTCVAAFATCQVAQTARVGGVTYSSVDAAYRGASSTPFIIEIIASNQQETLNFDLARDGTLKGGLGCYFVRQLPPAVTFVTGSVTVTGGSITFDGIAIK
ncbi:MAG: S8 family serine peptidase [Nitrospirae bacterium]|nr:S8 family serine peptidase [Nitrospirota bacterium]